jgi:hypothetical protein
MLTCDHCGHKSTEDEPVFTVLVATLTRTSDREIKHTCEWFSSNKSPLQFGASRIADLCKPCEEATRERVRLAACRPKVTEASKPIETAVEAPAAPVPIELGQKVRDRLSDFVGVVVARVDHLYGSPEVFVESKKSFGAPLQPVRLPEARVEAIQPTGE